MMTPEIAFILLGCTVLVLILWGLIRGSQGLKWFCGFLLVLIVFGGLIDVPCPAARRKATRAQCMNNMRMIGLAIEEYRTEHDGTSPATLGSLTNQAVNPRLFVCMESGNTTGDLSRVDTWMSYVYRPNAGTSEVRLYCPPKNHRNEGGNILFGDCSVSWFEKTRFEETLKTGTKEAPTTPHTLP